MHYADTIASPNVCTLRVVKTRGRSQTADMSNPEPVRKFPPNKVREFRDAKGWTQAQLAEAAGLSTKYIGNLENQVRGLNAKNLKKLCPVLNATPGELMDYKPEREMELLLEAWREIPEGKRPLALSILREIAEAA